MPNARPIPEGCSSVTPYLVVKGAAAALDYYTKAFGARELFRMPGPDGRILHAELQIGDSRVMLSDEMPEMGGTSPKTLKGTSVSLYLYVENVDAVFKSAIAAGATAKMPVSDMFWGDRWGLLIDPFGHEWQVATHIEDLTPEEMGRRAAEAMKPAS